MSYHARDYALIISCDGGDLCPAEVTTYHLPSGWVVEVAPDGKVYHLCPDHRTAVVDAWTWIETR